MKGQPTELFFKVIFHLQTVLFFKLKKTMAEILQYIVPHVHITNLLSKFHIDMLNTSHSAHSPSMRRLPCQRPYLKWIPWIYIPSTNCLQCPSSLILSSHLQCDVSQRKWVEALMLIFIFSHYITCQKVSIDFCSAT